MSDQKCPHCGADYTTRQATGTWFKCDTFVSPKNESWRNSDCYAAENATLRQQLADAKREAEGLCRGMAKDYKLRHPEFDLTAWGLCDSVAGVITQIDNMYAGIRNELVEAKRQLADEKVRADKASKKAESNYSEWSFEQLREHEKEVADLRARLEAAEARETTLTNLLRRANDELCNLESPVDLNLYPEITAALEGKPPTRDAEALLREAEGVLEPVVAVFNEKAKRYADAKSNWWLEMPAEWPTEITMTMGTLRAAATLLAKIREGR